MRLEFPKWTGETCIIVGSGPSAMASSLERVAGRTRVIAVNNAWRLAPWADMLYAADGKWWRHYGSKCTFRGMRVTGEDDAAREFEIALALIDKRSEIILTADNDLLGWGGNGGLQALNIAVKAGCRRAILVGIDARLDRGSHCHGDHPQPLANPREHTVKKWLEAFNGSASVLAAAGVDVINCSPISSITAFPRMSLEDALDRQKLIQ